MSLEDRLHWFAARYVASPQWFKTTVGGAYSLLPRRIWSGRSYGQFATRFQSFHPTQVDELLAQTLVEALSGVPAFAAYSRLAAEARRNPRQVLAELPLTHKEDIKRDLPRYLNGRQPAGRRLEMFTGGSTAVPMTFYIQRGVGRAKELAAFDTLAHRWGTDGEGVVLALRGRSVPTATAGRMSMYDPIRRYLILSSDHLEPRYMPQYVAALRRWRPRFVHAFPSALYPLVLWLRDHGQQDLLADVRSVTLFSETVFEHHMAAFRQFFDCPVIVTYGHTERVLFATTLPDDTRYHFWPLYGHFELVDGNGKAVTQPGQVGEIVGTSFDNLVMPFVRYRTGDYAVLGREPDVSMPGSPVVDRIEGRLQEFIVCADHRLVTVTTIGAAHLTELERCLRIQYEQFEPGKLTLRVMPLRPMSQQDKHRVREAIRHKTQGGCEVDVLEVDNIELTARGKQRLLVQHLDVGRYMGSALSRAASFDSAYEAPPTEPSRPGTFALQAQGTPLHHESPDAVGSPSISLHGSVEILERELGLLGRHLTRRAVLAKRRSKVLIAGERDDAERLLERQATLLAASLNAAVRRIPGYRSIGPVVADDTVFELLRQSVPVTSKNDLLSGRGRLYPNAGRRRPWWSVGKTSGTSGTPLEVFRDVGSVIWEEAFHIQSWHWAGLEPDEPQAVLRGDLVALSDANAQRNSLWDPFGRQLFLATRKMSSRTVAQMVDACRRRGCTALRAYPSAADQLAKLVEESGLHLKFKVVITSSEPLYPVQRERIERAFGCKILNIYGMAERVAYATQCEQGHLHLNSDYSFVEILDDAGQPTDDFGSIVGTTFRNRAMPLLRYRVADKARWIPGVCPCGRAYPRIELASGKVEDQLFDRDGLAVNASIVTFAFKGVSNIAKAQVAQIDPYSWEIRIVPGRDFTSQDSDRLLANLNHYVSSRVAYAVKVVADIPPLPSGKYKWITQEWVKN